MRRACPPCLAVDWLVLAVDRSNSIDERELALQRNAYVRLLWDAQVIEALGPARVAIVEFDSRSEIVVDWSDPAAAAIAYRRKPPDGLRGQTAIGSALATALGLLAGKSGRLVVDVSGDGRENVDHALLAQARAAATAQAIEINGLAILNGEVPEIDRYYSGEVANGFVLSVERGEDFLAALKRKLFYEVAGRATGSAGAGLAWRRASARRSRRRDLRARPRHRALLVAGRAAGGRGPRAAAERVDVAVSAAATAACARRSSWRAPAPWSRCSTRRRSAAAPARATAAWSAARSSSTGRASPGARCRAGRRRSRTGRAPPSSSWRT